MTSAATIITNAAPGGKKRNFLASCRRTPGCTRIFISRVQLPSIFLPENAVRAPEPLVKFTDREPDHDGRNECVAEFNS